MAYSFVEYTGDGVSTDYNVNFPYLARAHVSVLVATVPVAFTWLSDTQVRITVAPAMSAAIKVLRTTPTDARLVNFVNGSTLNPDDDLDADADQLFFIQQEMLDNGLSVGANQVNTAGIADGAVTPAKLADTAVTPGTYIAGTFTVNAKGQVTSAVATVPFTAEDAEDAIGGILTDTPTIDLTYNDVGNQITADVIDASITNAKLALMPAHTFKANPTGASAAPQDLTRDGILRALCLCTPTSGAATAPNNPSSNPAAYVPRTGYMYGIGVTNAAFKMQSRKGVVTALTPSTLAGGSRGGCIYLGDALHKVLYWGSGGGFITMDVDTDTFDSLVAPTGWGQISADYHVGSGYVYYAGSDRPHRCLVDGTSHSAASNPDAITSPGRVCLVGDLLFVSDDTGAGASKVWKWDLASWPTRGSAVTLAGDMGLIGGLAALGSTYLLVGDYNGTLLVIDPATLATVQTITLSGVAGRKTEHTIYDATVNRIYSVDSTGRIYVIDGTTFAVLGTCTPYNGAIGDLVSAGLTYDPDTGLLTGRTNASTLLYRFFA